MCGIAGIINFDQKEVDKEKLIKMTNLLSHRGPDFGDIFIDKNIGLGHRRLSIIDLSTMANQPLQYQNSGCYIIYNGEVYNYIELKDELKKLGYTFRTSSDTEVILASYLEWGEGCFHKFNGMWAIAIYNNKTKEVLLCRDRFGEKPLYYYEDTDKFIFASEKKAIVLSDFVKLEFDIVGIRTAIQNPFVLEASGFTEFKGVKNLLPGHLIKIKGNKIENKRWYSLLDNIEKGVSKKFTERVEIFREIFRDSCKIRLRSDVPIATSLSGGLDSSSVVAMLSQIDVVKHKTFTHSFKGTSLDESKYAKIVAESTGTPLNIIEVDKDDIRTSIDDIIYYFESIYAGMPDSPYRIYRAQKAEGYKISIDGHGADEMLAGYGWYLDELRKDIPFFKISKHLEIKQHKNEITLDVKAKRLNILEFIYNLLPRYKRSKIKKTRQKKLMTYTFETEALPKEWGHLKRRLYIDFNYTILPRILKNFDALSMANSIEVRMPFLDFRLVSLSLHYRVKI